MRTYILDLEDSWNFVDVPIDSGVVLGSVLPPEGVRNVESSSLGILTQLSCPPSI